MYIELREALWSINAHGTHDVCRIAKQIGIGWVGKPFSMYRNFRNAQANVCATFSIFLMTTMDIETQAQSKRQRCIGAFSTFEIYKSLRFASPVVYTWQAFQPPPWEQIGDRYPPSLPSPSSVGGGATRNTIKNSLLNRSITKYR